MDENLGHVLLIKQAQLGDKTSMDRLAMLAEERLSTYIYRLTLNHDVAQDLLQETLLKMVESLKDLERPESFWFWLFRSALGQVQHHFRDQRQKGMVQMSALGRERLSDQLSQQRDDGLSAAMRRELLEATVGAMSRLRLTYRNVLILRCFEQLSYAEIATVMECKELRARVLFLRASRCLRQQLWRRGFSKTLLLTALGLFGLITAPTKAASTAGAVTAASLDVGPVATVVATLSGKFALGAASAIAAVAVGLSLENVLVVSLAVCFVIVCVVIGLYID